MATEQYLVMAIVKLSNLFVRKNNLHSSLVPKNKNKSVFHQFVFAVNKAALSGLAYFRLVARFCFCFFKTR